MTNFKKFCPPHLSNFEAAPAAPNCYEIRKKNEDDFCEEPGIKQALFYICLICTITCQFAELCYTGRSYTK